MRTHRLLFIIAICIGAMPGGLNASQLTITSSLEETYVVRSSEIIDSIPIVDSGSYSAPGVFSSYDAFATYTDLGQRFDLKYACDNGCVFAGTLTLQSEDTLHILGASSGVLSLDVNVVGSARAVGAVLVDYYTVQYFVGTRTGYSVQSILQVTNFGPRPIVANQFGSNVGITYTPDPDNPGVYNFVMKGTAIVPFNALSLTLNQEFDGLWGCLLQSPGDSCDISVSSLHSASIGGAVVYDSFGNIVQGATVTSDSGFDYTRPLASSVPEPATIGIASIGLLMLAILRFNAARSCFAKTRNH